MSLYMSSHRKQKTFPFSYFGYAAIVSATVLFIYALSSDIPFFDIVNGSLKEHLPLESGIAATVLPVLSGIMGVGVVAKIKANFKIAPYFLHLAFFVLLSISGYFNMNGEFEMLPVLTAGAGFLNFMVLGIYLFLFNRSDSPYSSVPAAIMSIVPLAPLSFRFYIAAVEPSSIFGIDILKFDGLVNMVLIMSLFLYTLANSAYLEYVNRKAFHR